MRLFSSYLVLILFLQSCSSVNLNTKQDYQTSLRKFRSGYIKSSIESLPTNEKKSFITVMEKTYLNLLNGNPDIDELASYVKKIENRVRIKVSREIKTLFYVETTEGYYAAEHEIIWMHILISWGYSMRGDFENARVEAKKCAIYLSNDWSDEGRFDDAFLRIMLGAVWTMCGEWEEAQVDFKRAHMLNPKLRWCKRLANLDKQPENLLIILGGTGPEPFIKSDKSYISKMQNIAFKTYSKKSKFHLKSGSGKYLRLYKSPDSRNWYLRHLVRDNAIHEIIQNSQYMAETVVKTTGGAAGAVVVSAAATVLGVVIIFTGIGVAGLGIVGGIYVGGESGAYLASAGVVGGLYIIKAGGNVISSGYEKAGSIYAEATDISHIANQYRFVRFLPEYAWVNWNNLQNFFPFSLYNKRTKENIEFKLESARKIKNVFLYFLSDSSEYARSTIIDSRQIDKYYSKIYPANKINLKDEFGNTPLINAVKSNNLPLVIWFIQSKAELNLQNKKGETALILASKNGNIPAVKFLIFNGANSELKDNYGKSACDYALASNNKLLVKLLKDNLKIVRLRER